MLYILFVKNKLYIRFKNIKELFIFTLVDIINMFTGIFVGCENVNCFSGERGTSRTIFGDK